MEIFKNKIPIYYTYYSYEEWGRGYIGYHRCPKNKTPETDNYYGSYTDTSFNPHHKIILGVYFSKNEALKAEYLLHQAFNVVKNPHFVNKVMTGQTGKLMGVEFHSEETKEKIRLKALGRKASLKTKKKLSEQRAGRKNPFYGKTHSDEFKSWLSSERLGRKNPSFGSGKKRNFKNENLNIIENQITIRELFRKYPDLKNSYTPQGFSKAFSKNKKTYKDWEISI